MEGDTSCDIFEVFKTKTIPKSQIEQLEFNLLRKHYVMLKSIDNAEDIKGCTAFATIGGEERMVVDRKYLQSEIDKKVKTLAAQKAKDLDDTMENMKVQTEKFLQATVANIHTQVLEDVLAKVRKAIPEDEKYKALEAEIRQSFQKPVDL